MNDQAFFSVFTKKQLNLIPQLEQAHASASSNIALIKYWGKRDLPLNLPLTSSLSLSLGTLGTQVNLSLVVSGSATTRSADIYYVNGQRLDEKTHAYTRLHRFLTPFRLQNTHFLLDSENSVPTGAGLASSASAFAAITKALNTLYDWQLDTAELSRLARLGSGSAARSIESGFVLWDKGQLCNGMDCFAKKMDLSWPGLRWAVLPIDFSPKPISSTDAMCQTFLSSPFARSWPTRVENDLKKAVEAIKARNFTMLGHVVEHNAMAMHALMLSANPKISFFHRKTFRVLQWIQNIRAQGFLEVYATMDAGPNVKLLVLEQDSVRLNQLFEKQADLWAEHKPFIINPWE